MPTTFSLKVTHPPTPSRMAPRAASPAPSSLPGPRRLLKELLTQKTKQHQKEEMTSTHVGCLSFGGFTNAPSWVSDSSPLAHDSPGITRGMRHGRLTTHAQLTLWCPEPGTSDSEKMNERVNESEQTPLKALSKVHLLLQATRQVWLAPCYK